MCRNLWRRLTVGILCLLLFGCGCDGNSLTAASGKTFPDTYAASDTWVIYWYLCGTDLETECGAASDDLHELLQAKLSPNVRVIIQTGGTKRWQDRDIPSNGQGARFLYDGNGLTKLQTLPGRTDMGSASTLRDFLQFGKEHYPADHRVFVFWDHGGGSAVGVCLDEITESILSLDDVRGAFSAVYPPSAENPPFEVVGFDACMMATIDTVATLQGVSRYMVASEETEPGTGWKYDGWVGALAKNPAMGGAALGKVICDTYMEDARKEDVAETATLSVVDLAQAPNLLAAYGAFGVEGLQRASEDQRRFFTTLARAASRAENYGGNTREQGYTNMVDIGDFVQRARKAAPQTADALLTAVDKSVIYRRNGESHADSRGLSCFYPYDAASGNWGLYANLEVAQLPIKCLYYYHLFGTMPPEASQYLSGGTSYTPPAATDAKPSSSMPSALTMPQQATTIGSVYSVQALEDTSVDVNAEGTAFVQLSSSAMELLSAVHCEFFYFNKKDDVILFLGRDTNVVVDWDTGICKDNFFGQWPMLNGYPVYIEITYEGDGYNLYSIPIKLNGVACNLQVKYDYKTEKYTVLGARRGLESSGIADRKLIRLKKGDTVTTLHYGMTISGGEADFTQAEVDTFTLQGVPEVKDEFVGDGSYGYHFVFVGAANNMAWSQMVTYDIVGEQITTSVGEDLESGVPADGNAFGGTQTTAGSGNVGGSIADQVTSGSSAGGFSPGYGGASSVPSAGGGSIADRVTRR